MIYTCCEENRRMAVEAHPTLNGIDWLEVLDLDAPAGSPRQRTLMVRLLKPVPAGITAENLRIAGGERIRRVGIEWVGIASAPPLDPGAEHDFFTALPNADQILLVRTDSEGDHSTYRLHLQQGSGDPAPLPDFDPRLSAIDFAFKVECPSPFDCAPRHDCPEAPKPVPDLSYLARDYASLRRLIIDRLTRQMPGWRDHSPADLTTTLAELIAYVGDLQHYRLDAIGTEAYLHTARRRSSLRRHALLVDYAMHEGCNARAWLHVEVSGGPFALPEDLRCHTRVPGVPPRVAPDSPDERTALRAAPLVFEPLLPDETSPRPTLRLEHNDFAFYTWGDARCCLPVGATAATLRGHWPDLAPGDVLIFQETIGPLTGLAEDADPTHRHAVRLTAVRAFDGAEALVDPLDGTEITDIRWHRDDALPFPLCLSSETDEAHGGAFIDDVSIALGNNILVDHGRSIADESLGSVPKARLQFPAATGDACARAAPEPLPPRFRPLLAEAPVTHQGTLLKTHFEHGLQRRERLRFDPEASAGAAFVWRTADALPAITLESASGIGSDHWRPRRDLLASRATDRHFVLESEDDGSTRLRFGDDRHGRRPNAGTAFTARYRIGNGPEGNVGADSIAHAVTLEGRIERVTNPLPARGGVARESATEVRRRAPHAFRTQERAVTPADYAEVTERLDGVQRAAAGLRWTGSWHTLFATVDREGGDPVDVDFAATAIAHLDHYRMAGHDLRINDPLHVSLEIDLLVCVDAGYFRSDVRRGLLDVLGSHTRADGTRGLFHPDNFSFAQTVFLSPLYAAARRVPGVASVQVTRFHRQGQEDPKPLADGFLPLGRLEIARLDNDPNFPEHGVLRLDLHGGK
ncbi:putative baseplate assembly protein [Halomonas heilongjiangensis]|uniref:Putative baseplate assembly protein n=1 Tax=Halomonas heilongjiangensis TaxID=1387883 RepID=A0A2N7TFA1_9GAMM|nr:putative baseplate assembly protein [Halomonas heilongjiangensis]PMR66871.1 putative baseplate assembly protein [Halomonas heilongjiangensis]PXX91249.1 putative baseplate assembly protein [Halomonas heilongjiangensis]